jgi:hypothetical protein
MRKANVILDIIRNRGKKGLSLEDVYRQLFNPALYLEGTRSQGLATAPC